MEILKSISGDLRIDRLIKSRMRRVLNTGDATATVSADQQRVAIMFFITFDDSTPDIFMVDTLGSYHVNADVTIGRPLIFTFLTHGDLPTKQFRIDDALASNLVYIIEYYLPEDAIRWPPAT